MSPAAMLSSPAALLGTCAVHMCPAVLRCCLAYTIAYCPCAPRLLTLWTRAGPGAQSQ